MRKVVSWAAIIAPFHDRGSPGKPSRDKFFPSLLPPGHEEGFWPDISLTRSKGGVIDTSEAMLILGASSRRAADLAALCH